MLLTFIIDILFNLFNSCLPATNFVADAPVVWQLGFQNPATPVMVGIVTLYDYIFVHLVLVFFVVVWFLTKSLYLFSEERNAEPSEFSHDPLIETVWTIAPAFILVSVASPSFSLLYGMDDLINPMLTVKIIGHQWYWSYEYNVSRIDYYYDYVNANSPKVKGKYTTKPVYTMEELNVFNKKFSKFSDGPTLLRRSLTFKTLQHTILFKPWPHLYNFSSAVERACRFVNTLEYLRFNRAESKLLKSIGLGELVFDQKRTGLFHLFAPIGFDRKNLHSFVLVSPNLKFDSYMLGESDLPKGSLRLLEVDKRLVLPIDTHVRLLVTSADVIHSWAVPSLGVKVDAIPGRLNQVTVFIDRPGIFYGQCSELCGVNHAFMPIAVEAVEVSDFAKWVRAELNPKTLAEFKKWTARF